MQSPRWLTTDLLCSYFDRESSCQYRWRDRRHLGPDTKAAIKRFQRSLAVTGDLNAVTARAAAQHGERRRAA
jgi:hypothetical protein